MMKAKKLCLGKKILLHTYDHLPNSPKAGLEMDIKQIKILLTSQKTEGQPPSTRGAQFSGWQMG